MNETRSTRYQRLRRRTRVAGLSSAIAGLGLVALTPAAPVLYDWADGLGRELAAGPRSALALVVFVGVVVLIWELAALPAMAYSALAVSRRYGRGGSDLPVARVIGAQVQSALLMLPLVVLAAAVARAAVGWSGAWWWVTTGLALAAGLVAAMRLLPAFLTRVSGATPLDREDLAVRLARLAERAGVPVADILVLPAERQSGATAFVSGVGQSRRIFLASSVVHEWHDDEIAVVVAHELGHCVHQDAWRSAVTDTVLLCASLGMADGLVRSASLAMALPAVTQVSALPALGFVAILVWLAVTPVRHAQSRRHERRADAFALALTGSADAFDAAIRRLSQSHLAEEHPGRLARWLFARHPSVGERLQYARAYRDLMQV